MNAYMRENLMIETAPVGDMIEIIVQFPAPLSMRVRMKLERDKQENLVQHLDDLAVDLAESLLKVFKTDGFDDPETVRDFREGIKLQLRRLEPIVRTTLNMEKAR